MRIALAVLSLVAFAAAGASAAVPPYNLTTIYLTEGDFVRSIAVYQRALAANPRDSEAYYWLGVAYWEGSIRSRDGLVPYGAGYLDRAIDALEHAVSLDDKNLAAWQLLAQAYPTRGAAPSGASQGQLSDNEKGDRAAQKVVALSEDPTVAYKGSPRPGAHNGEIAVIYRTLPTRQRYNPADFYVIVDQDTKLVYKYPCASLPRIAHPALFLTKWEAFARGYKPATICTPP
ncbi:MAG TPA: tetratricopeptide repeat protein [bacterium]|nr:tetratricopeptide repeat protein [bacterium]